MDILIDFQIHIFSFTILLILFFIFRRSKVKNYGSKLIYRVVILSGIGILLEPVTWLLEMSSGIIPYTLEHLTNALLFLVAQMLAGACVSYTDFYIFKDYAKLRARCFYIHTTLLTLIMLIINVIYPIYYEIDKITNHYHVGSLIFIHYCIILAQYSYIGYLLLVNSEKLTPRERYIMFILYSLPIIGMILQYLEPILFFVWPAPIATCMGIYVFFESASPEEDFLTKLYNRKSYDTYVEYLVLKDQLKGIMLIDLDDFKAINDTYGHNVGDQVLIEFSNKIQTVFEKYGLPFRLGGDEFAIVFQESSCDLEKLIDKVSQDLLDHNNDIISNLQFSYGYETYTSDMPLEMLYIEADKKLYSSKNRSK